MKKMFLIAGISALAVTGCTSEEVIDVNYNHSNVIGFENVVNKASKAGVEGDLTNANFDRFLVYSYYTPANKVTPLQIFDNEPVTRTIGQDVWSYASHLRYWVPGATYYFYAYSCGDIALDNTYGTPSMSLTNSEPESRVLRITNYVCSDSHQHDLVYAMQEGIVGKDVIGSEVNPGVGTANQNVKFQFQHLLSKIDAKFVSDMPNDYEVVISNVRIENIRNYGTYNPKATPAWGEPQRVNKLNDNEISTTVSLNVDDDYDVARAEYTDADGNTVAAVDVTTKHAYVIPYNYNQGDVQLKFTISLMKNKVVAMSRNLSGSWSPKWELGKNYTYTIKITGDAASLEPIVFETVQDAAIGSWLPGENIPEINFSGN